MSYIQPDFIINTSQDNFVSLEYETHVKMGRGTEEAVQTDEVNSFVRIPCVDNKYIFGNIESQKFYKDKLVLATLDNKILYINESGELILENK